MYRSKTLSLLIAAGLSMVLFACGDAEPKGEAVPNGGPGNSGNIGFPNSGTNSGTNNANVATNSSTNNIVVSNSSTNNVDICGPSPGVPEQAVGFVDDFADRFGTVSSVDPSLLVIDTNDESVQFNGSGLDLTQYFEVEEEVVFYTTTNESRSGGFITTRLQAVGGSTHTVEIAQVWYSSPGEDLGSGVSATLPETGQEVTLGSASEASTCFERTDCGLQARQDSVNTVNVGGDEYLPGQLDSLGEGDIFVLNASSVQYEEVIDGDCIAEGGTSSQMTVLVASPIQ